MFDRLTYGDALAKVRCLGQALLDRQLTADRPLAILSGNSVEHLLLALAAQHVGVPYAPISPAYSLLSSDFSALQHALALVSPGLVFASDRARFAPRWMRQSGPMSRSCTPNQRRIQGDARHAGRRERSSRCSRRSRPATSIAAHASIAPDDVAKILFTSGSTGTPKGVINTHRMLCSNQQMILQTLPFLGDEPPVLVDWLPWHHTFGGNHNIGIVVYNGGSLYLDEGRPMPGAFAESVRNLSEIAPTVYLNVPKGYEELVRALRADRALAATFFGRVQVLFYAAAGLSQHVADELQEIAVETCGERLVLVTGLGSTETAPMAICRPWASELSSAIGLPVPGVDVKLVPSGEKLEIRVRGPNVTPGYWRQDDLTRAAFDDEGFYCMGDAVRLVDSARSVEGARLRRPDQGGLQAVDRHVGQRRPAARENRRALCAVRPRRGHHRSRPRRGRHAGRAGPRRVPDALSRSARRRAGVSGARPCRRARTPAGAAGDASPQAATGSATRIARAILLDEPPSLDAGEITDKGSLNQRAILERRRPLVDELYADPPPAHVITPLRLRLCMNVDDLTAIDVHVHLEHDAKPTETDERAEVLREGTWPPGAQALADYYRSRRMACVVFTVDEHLTGRPHLTNEEILAFAAANADIAIPFVSVDPTRGAAAVEEARRLVATGAVRGLKLHPPLQQFFPNDRLAYPLYEVFAEAKLPVLIHTGHSGIGTGMRGGGGVRLKYGNPMHIDDVAVDFPDMPIILAHPSFPWQDEAISVCLHKPQVYIDLSGWSPKYFSPTLVQYANTLLKHKVLFGSDYPWITPDRWLADFDKIDIRDDVRPLVLKANAARLFGLWL